MKRFVKESKLIDAWHSNRNRVQELQEIYQKTYFLPDEQHLKVGEEYSTLKLEKFSWELLYLLFEDEKKSIDNISDHLNQQELKKFVWRVSHKEVVNQMMKTAEFRKLQVCFIFHTRLVLHSTDYRQMVGRKCQGKSWCGKWRCMAIYI